MTDENMDEATQENLLNLVKQNYEKIAAEFDATRKKALWPEIVKLAGLVQDGDKVLDVGCGNGRLAEAFKDRKIEYLGVDQSEKLIELARKNYESRIKNHEFRKADILELDKLPEKDFDYVFCLAVLHHLPGEDLKKKALEQLKDKLAPGGKMIITVWNLWRRKKFCWLIYKYAWLKLLGLSKMDCGDILFDWKNSRGEKLSRRYYHAFTTGELKKLATAAGLKVEKAYHDKYNYYLILSK